MWCDAKSKAPRVTAAMFKTLKAAVGTSGLSGLDRLCAYMTADELTSLFRDYIDQFSTNEEWEKYFAKIESTLALNSRTALDDPEKYFDSLAGGSKMAYQTYGKYAERVRKIGQLQLVRSYLLREVAKASNVDASILATALQNLNRSVLQDFASTRDIMNGDDVSGTREETSALLYELGQYLEIAGRTDPFNKVYVQAPRNCAYIGCVLFLSLLAALPNSSSSLRLDWWRKDRCRMVWTERRC